MSTLYKPVLIESAEQAEALPIGTVAIDASGPSEVPQTASIRDLDGWECSWKGGIYSHQAMVGSLALVPIEAEERIGSEMCHQISDKRYDIHVLPAGDEKQARWQIENNPDYATGRIMRQYRTPWEEA